MRIGNNRSFVFSLFLLVIASFLHVGTVTSVRAAAPSKSEVYTGAPHGMDFGDYFERSISYNNTNYFSESVANSVSYQYGGIDGKTNIIQMTDGGANEVSSIWGRMMNPKTAKNDYNYFDLTKPQTISAWLYFGSGSKNIDANTVGSGMAFVLQNDPRGTQAISTYTRRKNIMQKKFAAAVGGQSLGVWAGISGGYTPNNVEDFAKGAIQNSLAVEFDTVANVDKPGLFTVSADDSFDAFKYKGFSSASGQHIAWGYPACNKLVAADPAKQVGTYFRDVNETYYFYEIVHRDVINNQVMAGFRHSWEENVAHAWHHFTFQYTPPVGNANTAEMSYFFDDKKYDGTPNNWRVSKKNIMIDLTNLDYPNNKKARWGFTSSTDKDDKNKSAVNAVVLESASSVADVETHTSIYNETQGRPIFSLGTNSQKRSDAIVGDDLRYDYSLNYRSGIGGTGKIHSVIELPSNVDFSSHDGNAGRIIYGEGANQKTVAIPTSNLRGDQLHVTLDGLNSYDSVVKIQVYGKATIEYASDKLVTYLVKPAHTSYTSSHYVSDVMTPDFYLSNDSLLLSSTDKIDQTVNLNKSGQINLTTSYKKGSIFDNQGLTFYTQIDDKPVTHVTSSTVSGDTHKIYHWLYDASVLGLGEHTVKIYAMDSNSEKSNPLTFHIIVKDHKELSLTSDNTDITSLLSEDTKMAGVASYSDGSTATSDIKLHWSIDGGSETSEPLNEMQFVHTIRAGILDKGQHTVTVYADDRIRKSNPLTYRVTVTNGSVTLENDPDYGFQTINRISAINRIVHRAGTWKLAVKSRHSAWRLTAKSDGLINNSTHLPLIGELIYVAGSTTNSLQNPVLVDEDETISMESRIKDIAGTWGENNGILLKVQPSTSEGGYTGTISWTLTASVGADKKV